MKTKRWMWLFTALSVLMICFIWGNSVRTEAQSTKQSDAVVKVLKPKLNASQKLSEYEFTVAVRKSAHVLEYVALGLCVGAATLCLGRLQGKRLASMPLLIVLTVAVIDEYIQHFCGRGSAVTDVVLDFTSALTGIAFTALLCLLINKWKTKGKEVA